MQKDATDKSGPSDSIGFSLLSGNDYKELFERIPLGVYYMNAEGRLMDVNEALVQLLGYESRDAMLTVNLFSLDVDSALREKWHKQMEQKGIVSNFEISWTHCRGHGIFIEENAVAVKDDPGKILGYWGIVRDITVERRLEKQLHAMQKMQALATLTAGIAHDFNNILSAVFGYTQMALMNVPSESPLHQNLTEVLKAGYRARDLVKQILTFSRETEVTSSPIQLTPIIKEMLKFLRSSIPSTIQIQETLKTTPAGWDTIMAAPFQIHQMLMTLCVHAAEAMRERGGTLEVHLEEVSSNEEFLSLYPHLKQGPSLQLTVAYSGPGGNFEILNGVFDPTPIEADDRFEGEMGLNEVTDIVRSLGGAIRAENRPGQKTSFHVVLPRILPVAELGAQTTGPLHTGTERILLVDDETALVDIGKKMLTHLGYQVVGLNSSIEALKLFTEQSNTFDLIIVDLTMPQMTGLDLARKCLQIRSDIPVMLCTGLADPKTFEKAKAIGVREILRKPIMLRLLAETVRDVLMQRSPQHFNPLE